MANEQLILENQKVILQTLCALCENNDLPECAAVARRAANAPESRRIMTPSKYIIRRVDMSDMSERFLMFGFDAEFPVTWTPSKSNAAPLEFVLAVALRMALEPTPNARYNYYVQSLDSLATESDARSRRR